MHVVARECTNRYRASGIIEQDKGTRVADAVVAINRRHGVRCDGADEGVNGAVSVVPDGEELALEGFALGVEVLDLGEREGVFAAEARNEPGGEGLVGGVEEVEDCVCAFDVEEGVGEGLALGEEGGDVHFDGV